MDQFPDSIKPSNKDSFIKEKKNYYTRLLRQKLTEFVLNGDENDFFDINSFNKEYIRDEIMCESIFAIVIDELTAMGWKYKISFGGTGPFLYSSENPPLGAW